MHIFAYLRLFTLLHAREIGYLASQGLSNNAALLVLYVGQVFHHMTKPYPLKLPGNRIKETAKILGLDHNNKGSGPKSVKISPVSFLHSNPNAG